MYVISPFISVLCHSVTLKRGVLSTEDAATTMVHAFFTRVDYCNSVLHRVSAANVQPRQNVLNAAALITLHKRKDDHITTDVRD